MGFYLHDFLTDRESSILGVWAAPGPPFWTVSWQPGAACTSQSDDFRSVRNSYIKDPREMALELVFGTDFSCKLLCGAGPVDLKGSRGAGVLLVL